MRHPLSLTFAVPSRHEKVSLATLNTLFALAKRLTMRGDQVSLSFVGHAEIGPARNLLASAFLDDGGDAMIGIDDDIGVDPDLAIRLLDLGHPYLGVYHPPRQISLEGFHRAAQAGKTAKGAQLAAAPLVGPPTSQTGIFPVEAISTSFFILRRAALLQVVDRCGLVRRPFGPEGQGASVHGFYDNLRNAQGSPISEDYSFCQRLREAGVTIHAYRGPGISHTGAMTFHS